MNCSTISTEQSFTSIDPFISYCQRKESIACVIFEHNIRMLYHSYFNNDCILPIPLNIWVKIL